MPPTILDQKEKKYVFFFCKDKNFRFLLGGEFPLLYLPINKKYLISLLKN